MDYNIDQVKKYLDIYGDMVYQSNEFKHGARLEEHRMTIRKTLERARMEFPDELKDDYFYIIMEFLKDSLKR